MTGTACETVWRTPKCDAPPHDPSIWEGKDCAFITLLHEQYLEQQRLERYRSTEIRSSDDAATADRSLSSVSHTLPVSRPTTWWGKIIAYLFPHYYARQAMEGLGFSRLGREELVNRMHFAFKAGDKEVSALIARELARRRATLYDSENDGNDTAGGGNRGTATGVGGLEEMRFDRGGIYHSVGDTWSFMHSAPLSGAAHVGFEGITTRSGGAQPAADASLAVPEVLLRRRRSAGPSGSMRF